MKKHRIIMMLIIVVGLLLLTISVLSAIPFSFDESDVHPVVWNAAAWWHGATPWLSDVFESNPLLLTGIPLLFAVAYMVVRFKFDDAVFSRKEDRKSA